MTIISKESMGQSYENVKKFNTIASNLKGTKEELIEKIDEQLGFAFEELTEAIDGFESKDAQGLLDGAVDLWVTVGGLLQKLEAAGFDVEFAMRKVDQNNLEKFPTYGTRMLIPEGCSVESNDKFKCFVFKNGDGKVCKPLGHKKVDLSDCVPGNFFGTGDVK